MKPRREFWVVCSDYVSGPYLTSESAERQIEHIQSAGYCGNPHDIVESATKPIPSGKWAREYYAGRD